MDERKLVEACQRGDQEARRELYERTSPRIYRLLLRMTGCPDTAFDLAQDTYVKAFTSIARFDGRSTTGTWLYRLAVNEALQHLRRKRTARQALRDRDPAGVLPGDGTVLRLDMTAALASLGGFDRALLLLRSQEGLDYRTMAAVLECAEGTIASRLNRARDKLRELLGEGYAEEPRRSAHLRGESPAERPASCPDEEPGKSRP